MKRLALFAIPLAFAVGTIRARQVSNTSAGVQTDTAHPESADYEPKPMTPRQVAEMHAEILMARKDYAEAALAYQRILEGDPRNPTLLNWTGMAYEQLGENELAEHFYKKAVNAQKDFSIAINNLGTLEYSKGHYARSIKYYKKAIGRPENANGIDRAPIYSNLGYAYCGIKEYPRAMDAFGKALAIDPTVFDHRGTSGSILQQRSAPDPASLYFLLAKSYAKTGDIERTAHYLKLARDDGYKDILTAEKDPDFARVIKAPQVQDVLRVTPPYANQREKAVSN
jgi:tetratricopeptide (TPR) repeat protein